MHPIYLIFLGKGIFLKLSLSSPLHLPMTRGLSPLTSLMVGRGLGGNGLRDALAKGTTHPNGCRWSNSINVYFCLIPIYQRSYNQISNCFLPFCGLIGLLSLDSKDFSGLLIKKFMGLNSKTHSHFYPSLCLIC